MWVVAVCASAVLLAGCTALSASEPGPTVTVTVTATPTPDPTPTKRAAPVGPGSYILGDDLPAGLYESVEPIDDDGPYLGCEASISLKGDVIYYEDVMSGPVAFDFPEAEGGILELSPGCPDIRHVG
jgi:hypothetical protein